MVEPERFYRSFAKEIIRKLLFGFRIDCFVDKEMVRASNANGLI
jgi:hypothetical protein